MLSCIAAAAMVLAPDPTYAIEHVNVVLPGSTLIARDRTVVWDKERIRWVGESSRAKLEAGTIRIDGSGKFLIPGLWDMHVHLAEPQSLGLFTANGVTGARVMFGNPVQLKWRRSITSGQLVGPQLVLASPIGDGPKPVWTGSIPVSTPEEARAAVRKIKADGYDFVKVYSLLSRASYFAIADECRKLKFPFAGHVPHSVGILEAQQAGQKSAEHLMGIAVECSTDSTEVHQEFDKVVHDGLSKAGELGRKLSERVLGSYDADLEKSLLMGLRDGSLWQCPTLVVLRNIAMLDQDSLKSDARLRYVNPFIKGMWDPKTDFRFKDRKPEDWERARASYRASLDFAGKLIRNGARFLAGTDCLNPYVYPGFSLHDELALLVEAGMTPTQALATATSAPADYFGWSKRMGTVETGKLPNLVLLDANPVENIRNTTKIQAVIQRGEYLDRARLDEILASREFKR